MITNQLLDLATGGQMHVSAVGKYCGFCGQPIEHEPAIMLQIPVYVTLNSTPAISATEAYTWAALYIHPGQCAASLVERINEDRCAVADTAGRPEVDDIFSDGGDTPEDPAAGLEPPSPDMCAALANDPRGGRH